MAQARGSKTRLLIDTETTFKSTRGSPDAHVLPFVSETLRLNRNIIESRTIRSSRNPSVPVRGNTDVSGDITVELSPYMGKMLFHALGTFTTSGSSTYSHTFTISELPPGLTIETQFTDLTTPQYFRYNGCKVNSMRLTFKPEGFVDTVFNIIGAAATVTTTSFDSSPVDYTSSSVGGPFDGYEAAIYEGGNLLGTVTGLDISIENNLDGNVYVLDGTGQRYSLPEGLVKVSGTLTALFEDVTLYNKAANNQESSLRIVLTHGTGDGSAYNEKLEIYIDELLYQPQSPVINGPEGILVELPFIGYYQNGSGASAIRFILWNTQTANDIQN